MHLAKKYEKQGKLTEAIELYKEMVAESSLPSLALSQIHRLSVKNNLTGGLSYINAISNGNTATRYSAKMLIAGKMLEEGRFDDAMQTYNAIVAGTNSREDAVYALTEQLFAYLHIKEDWATAKQLLTQIKRNMPADDMLQKRIAIAENMLSTGRRFAKKSSPQTQSEEIQPKYYALSHNYPNPFNPTTTIRYQIPHAGMVQLTVYDILGKEVAVLVNKEHNAGSYTATFDGSKLASGVYMYKLTAGTYTATKKLNLLK